MVADVLATQGAGGSAVMVLMRLSRNITISQRLNIWFPKIYLIINNKRISIENMLRCVLFLQLMAWCLQAISHCPIHWCLGLGALKRDWLHSWYINTLRPKQNGRRFADDSLKWIFFKEKFWILIEIHWSLFLMVQFTKYEQWFR